MPLIRSISKQVFVLKTKCEDRYCNNKEGVYYRKNSSILQYNNSVINDRPLSLFINID